MVPILHLLFVDAFCSMSKVAKVLTALRSKPMLTQKYNHLFDDRTVIFLNSWDSMDGDRVVS